MSLKVYESMMPIIRDIVITIKYKLKERLLKEVSEVKEENQSSEEVDEIQEDQVPSFFCILKLSRHISKKPSQTSDDTVLR